MLRVLDLFSGIGGFTLGLEATGGFKTIGFCEIDPFASAVLKKRFPGVPNYGDILKLTSSKLQQDNITSIEVLCGGFPCQDISLPAHGKGIYGEQSGLWFEYERLIAEMGPRWVIIENVAALRSKGLITILQNLSEIRYDAEWHCIPGTYVGTAHRRDRIWIIAYPRNKPRLQTLEISRPIGSKRDAWHNVNRISWQQIPGTSWRIPKPISYRSSDAIPYRVERLKAIGNAVIPFIPKLIGEAILKEEMLK